MNEHHGRTQPPHCSWGGAAGWVHRAPGRSAACAPLNPSRPVARRSSTSPATVRASPRGQEGCSSCSCGGTISSGRVERCSRPCETLPCGTAPRPSPRASRGPSSATRGASAHASSSRAATPAATIWSDSASRVTTALPETQPAGRGSSAQGRPDTSHPCFEPRARVQLSEWVQLAMSRSERTHASGCPVSARPILTQLADDAPTGVCASRGSWRPRSRQPPPDGRAVSRDASARTRPHRAVDRVGAPQRRSPTGSNTTDRPAPRRYDSSTGDRGTVWRPCLRRSQPLSFSHLSTPSDVARVSCLARAARLRHKSHSSRAHIPTGPRGLGCSGAQDAHLSPWSCGTGRAMMDP